MDQESETERLGGQVNRITRLQSRNDRSLEKRLHVHRNLKMKKKKELITLASANYLYLHMWGESIFKTKEERGAEELKR